MPFAAGVVASQTPRMDSPSRGEAIATLQEGQSELDRLLANLSDAELTERATIGGGDWSAKDLIGHMAHWEELALEAIVAARAAEPYPVQRSADEENAQDIERKALLSLDEVRSSAVRTHQMLLEELEAMTDDEWRSKPMFGEKREGRLGILLGGILGAPKRPFGHAFAHLDDVKAYADSLR